MSEVQDVIVEEQNTDRMRQQLFQERVWIEQERKELEELRQQLEQQRRDFRMEQDMTADRNRVMQKQLEQEKKLFEMKWRILEDELRQLAADKEQIERQRQEYQVLKEQKTWNSQQFQLFFIGVSDKKGLKKRYKDLIKMFHPDNLAGDKATLQEINREYESLKQIFL